MVPVQKGEARMTNKVKKEKLQKALADGKGVLRMAPAWVPRSFLKAGGRLKLHPDDLFPLGLKRGGISERWFSSTTQAYNGPGTPEDEGLSYVVVETGHGVEKVLFRDAVDRMGDVLLGEDVMRKHGGWRVLCKFFDNETPIPLHVHLMDKDAERIGKKGKPEGYYFPPEYNAKENSFPITFFGLTPGTTKDQVRKCLEMWDQGDNGLAYLSQGYKLKPGTGWNVPAGILHAPGTLVTYEPQNAFDVFSLFQNVHDGLPVDRNLLIQHVPEKHHFDFDYLVEMLDWEANVDPEFRKHHYLETVPVQNEATVAEAGYAEKKVVYGSSGFSATELTVFPGKQVTITDTAAYGVIAVAGRGRLNAHAVETPTIIRYGNLTRDEFFVTRPAAERGVAVKNVSDTESLVMLKHFGPC